MCSCNKTIYRYFCKTIGGNGTFISRVDLGLLLLAVSFCPVFWRWGSESTIHIPAMKWLLKVCIYFSEFLVI